MVIALGGIDAPLETRKGFDIRAIDVGKWEVYMEIATLLVQVPVVVPDLGFGFAQAAEKPLAVNQSIDQGALFGSGSLKALVVFGGERFERLGVFAADDVRGGVDTGLESVHASDGFALDGARATQRVLRFL